MLIEIMNYLLTKFAVNGPNLTRGLSITKLVTEPGTWGNAASYQCLNPNTPSWTDRSRGVITAALGERDNEVIFKNKHRMVTYILAQHPQRSIWVVTSITAQHPTLLKLITTW